MKRMKRIGSLILGGCLLASTALAFVENNALAPDFTLTDTHGKKHTLSAYRGKYVVLEWVNYDCPFIKKHYHSGNMQKLQKEFTAKGVVWLSINSSADGKQGFYTPEQINRKMAKWGAAPTAYLYDTDGTVGKTYGAQTTPHMFIINPEGRLIYQGAIDSIPSYDPADIPKADNYVADALNAALAGKPIAVSRTKSYGCSVKY